MKKLLLLFVALVFTSAAAAQSQSPSPRVLIVIAHPDDESGMAATVYKITHDLGGEVDLALITNGEGGYKYSTLAESIYHLKLTDEKIGRANLPRIRKEELQRAGKIIGIHHYYFLNQKDRRYTMNVHEPLDSGIWDIPFIERKLHNYMMDIPYDYIFTTLPEDSTHAHHKAAAILALQAAAGMPADHKPIVLAVTNSSKNRPMRPYHELEGYPSTLISINPSPYVFDRTQSFGYRNALNYKTVVNWEIAEHKSQGTMQMGPQSDYEDFLYFDANGMAGMQKTDALFQQLAVNHYPTLDYPGELPHAGSITAPR